MVVLDDLLCIQCIVGEVYQVLSLDSTSTFPYSLLVWLQVEL